MIGLFNIGGTIAAGALGQHYQKKYLLAQIYLGRTVIAAAFIMAPMTPASVLIFSVLMGSLWLATVPLTSGLVAQIWGLRYMGTLYGIVFLSHQLGGFLGIWLGGRLYDIYGNYTLVWWIGVGVGAFSALVHLPIRERPARSGVSAGRSRPSSAALRRLGGHVVERGVVERVEPRVEPAAARSARRGCRSRPPRPLCSTMMRSAPRIVASRWAMTRPVRPSSSRTSAFWISISV